MSETTTPTADEIRARVRDRYAEAARAAEAAATPEPAPPEPVAGGCCGMPLPAAATTPAPVAEASGCCGAPAETPVDARFGAARYEAGTAGEAPAGAAAASLGCGNPVAVAELHEGETVLDLGSGGGLDVILSARRVGPTGFAYGLDMTDEMLALAEKHSAEAGVENVKFLRGEIEDIPLPDGAVDVIISNCVINLSADKPRVFAEAFRVLRPGGRFAVSDIVTTRPFTAEEKADLASWTGCIAGALTDDEYRGGLEAAGFVDVEIIRSHEVADDAVSAIIRATRSG